MAMVFGWSLYCILHNDTMYLFILYIFILQLYYVLPMFCVFAEVVVKINVVPLCIALVASLFFSTKHKRGHLRLEIWGLYVNGG